MRRLLAFSAALLAVSGGAAWAQQGTVTLSREVSSAKFQPGGLVEVTLTIGYTGTTELTSLGGYETIPTGWSASNFTGPNLPEIMEVNSASGRLEYAYIAMPTAYPAVLKYTLRAALGDTQDRSVSGRTIYSVGPGSQQQSAEVTTAIFYDAPQDDTLTLARQAGPNYTAGTPLPVTVTLDHTGTGILSELVVREALPAGWQVVAPSGEGAPGTFSLDPKTNVVRFGFSAIPAFPATFTYQVIPLVNVTGAKKITGVLRCKVNGQDRESAEASTDLTLPSSEAVGCSAEGCAKGGGLSVADLLVWFLTAALMAFLPLRP
jgi:hypothetical protein